MARANSEAGIFPLWLQSNRQDRVEVEVGHAATAAPLNRPTDVLAVRFFRCFFPEACCLVVKQLPAASSRSFVGHRVKRCRCRISASVAPGGLPGERKDDSPGMVKHNLRDGGVETDRVVTLVDGSAFPSLYHSWDAMGVRDDLSGGQEIVQADPCVPQRKVVELLVQQLEEAELVVVNKDDIATDEQLKSTLSVCAALNPTSAVTKTNFGNVPLSAVLQRKLGETEQQLQPQQQLEAQRPQPSVEKTLMVTGINCGGCKKALTAALETVENLEIISIKHKGDTGNVANAVVVKGEYQVDAFRAALDELDGEFAGALRCDLLIECSLSCDLIGMFIAC